MEPPECPVCLQSYDGDTTIPRVLGCGHSACESCLTHLNLLRPPTLPHTLRCPSCTQLVKFPHPQGPSALPKNIDLLRFSLQTNPTPHNSNSNPPLLNNNSSPRRRFPPRIWSEELYAAWKDWVLPSNAVSVEDELVSCTTGRIKISSNFMDLSLSVIMRCRLIENQLVGLVKVGRFEMGDSLLEYSYMGKIMCVLSSMNDDQRNEISDILGVSMRNSRVCKVLGLWLDVENDGFVYLVTEKMMNSLLNFEDLGYGIDKCNADLRSLLGSIGVELCEAIICLNSEGFVCGCLNFFCLCFDEFGHICFDIGEALVIGRKFRGCVVEGVKGGREINCSDAELLIVKLLEMGAIVSPEVWMELLCRESIEEEKDDAGYLVCNKSDTFLLACVLINLIIGDKFRVEMYNYLKIVFQGKNERVSECKIAYHQWIETINAMLEKLVGSEYASVHEILLKCLAFDPEIRPLVIDVWKCIKKCNSYHIINNFPSLNSESMKENIGQCLVFGELCNVSNDVRNDSRISKLPEEHDDCKPNCLAGELTIDRVVNGLSAGKLQCKVLQGHLDCITGLCVGGGYLFSSSFDKTINVWSLQDFVHVHTFRGHEHRVMALVFLSQETPLCISADSGGGIYAWEINETLAQEPLKKWYEEKDWRYSGIHALAVSPESRCLYTGSGDRLIKAWSLRDYTLLCSMEGHKSVVSTLVLCNGVLYSGSWDGTIRLWCLHDHSPLAVFGEDIPGTVSSVLSLVSDQNVLIAGHENGCIKVWMNDELKTSKKIHNGAILALAMDERWFFLGGWDQTVKVQEITGSESDIGSESEMDIIEVGSLACDSVITAIRCVQGALFVGYANKLIKVYNCGA